MDPQLTALAIQEAPAVIALVVSAFKKKNPDVPPPSAEQVVAAYRKAFTDSVAVDEILKQHYVAEIAEEDATGHAG